MSEHAPAPTPETPPAPTPEVPASTPQVGGGVVKGFFAKRWNAVKGGGKDVGSTVWDTFKEYTVVDKSKGSPSVWGIIKGTSKAVWDTVSWKSNRGLLNFKGTSLNPLSKEKKFALNPMEGIRKIAAGTTLAVSKATGGIIGLSSDRLGNAIEGGMNATSRIVGGVIAGDYGDHMKQG